MISISIDKMKPFHSLLFSTVGILSLARCEEASMSVNEMLFELHFIYLVETRIDRFTNSHLTMIENFLLHNIEEQNWRNEGRISLITEIDTSPRDTINPNGEKNS